MDICDSLKKMGSDLSLLSQDALKVAAQKRTGKNDPKEIGTKKGLFSMKSLQPMTRLYQSKDEILKDKEDPGMAHIMGKLNDIFKG